MKRIAYSIFRNPKNVLKTGPTLDIKRHYRTLICNEEDKFQPTHDIHQYNFPKNIGFLMHLTHDKKETETQDEYKNRCSKQVMDIINTYGENNFVFLAYSTVFASKTQAPITTKTIKAIEEKFLNYTGIGTSSDLLVTPGHIALYTKEGKYISHSPTHDQSKVNQVNQDDIVRYDVGNSIKEGQQVSTYLMVLSRSYFPNDNFEEIRDIIKKYGWDAKGEFGQKEEKDNCATAIQKFLIGTKTRELMNPIQTLRLVVDYAINNINLTKDEQNVIISILLDSGLSRSLTKVSQQEEEYKHEFATLNEGIKSPTNKR